MQKKYFFFLLIGLAGLFASCQKDTPVESAIPEPVSDTQTAADRTGPTTTTSISQAILNGSLPVSAVYRNGRGRGGTTGPGNPEGGGMMSAPAPEYSCFPGIRINNAAALSAGTDAWGIGVVRLDNNLNPVSEALYGDCPNCLPLDQNNAFFWQLPGASTRWDIFLIYFDTEGLEYSANVTEMFPCNCSDPGGNDTYGIWSSDVHQFDTWMGCGACP